LVEMFVRDMPTRIDQMQSYAEAGNWKEVQRIAHQLKGAAGSYGFNQVTPYAACVETLIRQQQPEDQVLEAVVSLVTVCRRMRSGAPGT
jgi:HPt (histidine-containing phosphotransfer) domain-containing protein